MDHSNDQHNTTLKRLIWRSRRGTRELDRLLNGYLLEHGAGLGHEQLTIFSQLLEQPDPLLQDWFFNGIIPEDKGLYGLVREILSTHKN